MQRKRKKHSREQGMEDVSARKSCRKSSKFTSNSVSRDFVYFLTRLKFKFDLTPSFTATTTINKNDNG